MPQRLLAVGIDPAKHVHGVVAVLYPDRIVLEEQVPHDLQAMEALDARLEQLAVRHRAVLVYGIEDHRQYGQSWMRVLQAKGRQVRVVNPLWTRRQKDFYGQDKTDLVDARAIAAVVLRKADELPDATEASIDAATLREAARMLEDLAHQRTRALNRLHQLLTTTYLPSYEQCFGKLGRPWALRFFHRFPLPQDLNDLSVAQLAHILLELSEGRIGPHRREQRRAVLEQRARAILEATEPVRRLPKTPALLLRAELIRQLCEELLTSHERTLRLKRLLENDLLPRTGQHLQTLRGVDTVLAATILGETGDIRRFRSRHAFAKYNGTAPASHSSGGKERHTARRNCNHRLKRAMWLMAFAAVRHDPLARAYYECCRQRGLRPVEAIKRVARRMSDIVYAMLQEGKPYDPARVQASIAARLQKQAPGTGGTSLNGRNFHSLGRPGTVTVPNLRSYAQVSDQARGFPQPGP
ncbi:IS110 family transposase [Carboxydochorda subterranea]|uniref:IS110 family transposase n=1 Tax=Carboxydichorda subterranea TaxID=3109565 RepID=A0ABZ1C1B4_9FIRM|nr:IS110 family transposase [Limnochorda sp. L945t]WRP16202.1 IS110 family transposase [Limnochorda sp. L945t]WRP18739.1 IS110 family transposase [Limnochorda sp. L945t]